MLDYGWWIVDSGCLFVWGAGEYAVSIGYVWMIVLVC